MLILPKALFKRLRINFSRGVGLTARSCRPEVEFRVASNQLAIRVENDGVGIEYRAEHRTADTRFSIPFELLCEIEKQQTKQVCFDSVAEDGRVNVHWDINGATTVHRYPLSGDGDERRLASSSMSYHDAELLTALRQAMATTTDGSTRFAISNIELDGTDGCVTGTNGHELYTHRGFNFPFEEKMLIPKNRFFDSSELDSCESVAVGLETENNWISFDFGHWLIQLQVDVAGRFPNYRQVIPARDAVFTILNVSEQDADQLINSLDGLPALKEENSPITVDMNGKVCIRARAIDERASTETRLTTSTSEGHSSCFSTNRKLLSRAARLGFRRFEFFIDQSKLCCRDDRRIYIWMTLSDGQAATPSCASPTSGIAHAQPSITTTSTSTLSNQKRKRISMTTEPQTNQANETERRTPFTPDPVQLQRSVIEQAELVRSSLADSLVAVRTLITKLKRRKKQSQLVRTTLASLRELETVEV